MTAIADEMADAGPDTLDPGLSTKEMVAFGCLVVGTFLAILDIQIVASSVGALSASLGATLEEVAWVQSAYLTAEIIVIPLSAWMTTTFSTRNLMVAALSGFTVMSIACAAAWDLPSMIVFRILQGIFGGVMIPVLMSSVYLIFPPGRQAIALGAVGFVFMFPSILGPILGGWITETLSWHWIFLLNIPIGIVAAVGVYRTVDLDRPNFALLRRVDGWGIVLIAIFLASMEYVLKEGTKHDWYESELITQLTLVAIISFSLLVWRELSIRYPVIDIRLLRNSQLALGCALSFVTGFIQFVPVFLLPVILSSVRGFNSLQIGSVMIVMGVFAALSGLLAAGLEKKMDLRVMASLGFGLVAVGMWIDSDLTHQVGYDQLFWGQAARGLGMMLMFLPCSTVALGHLKPEEVANGSGFFNLMRNLGGAVGLSIITWMIQTRQDHHFHRLSEAMVEGRLAYDTVSGLPVPDMELDKTLPDAAVSQTALTEMATQLAAREALIMTYNDLWLIMAVLMALSFALIPFMRKPVNGAGGGMAH